MFRPGGPKRQPSSGSINIAVHMGEELDCVENGPEFIPLAEQALVALLATYPDLVDGQVLFSTHLQGD